MDPGSDIERLGTPAEVERQPDQRSGSASKGSFKSSTDPKTAEAAKEDHEGGQGERKREGKVEENGKKDNKSIKANDAAVGDFDKAYDESDGDSYPHSEEVIVFEKGTLHQLPPYHHKPLVDPGKQIRLLRFVAAPDGIIALTTHLAQVDEGPLYVTISYVWGSASNQRLVSIDGKHFAINKNCHYALWQISQQCTGESPYVWVDSICINQDDMSEKAAQVQMMGAIFENASTVYACVGRHMHHSRLFVEAVQALYDDLWRIEGPTCSDCRVQTWVEQYLKISANRLQGLPFRQLRDQFFQGCQEFGNRNYWKRLWIVQETWLARNLRVMCGDSSINIASFSFFWGRKEEAPTSGTHWTYLCGGFQDMMVDTLAHSRHLPSQNAISMGRRPGYTIPSSWERSSAQVAPWAMDILSAMAVFSSRKCENFRDRVFALQRLVAWPRDVKPPAPDYNVSGLQLFRQVMQRLHPFNDRGLFIFYEAAQSLFDLGVGPRSADVQEILDSRNISSHEEQDCAIPSRACLSYLSGRTIAILCENTDGALSANLEPDQPLSRDRTTKLPPPTAGQPLYSGALVIGQISSAALAGDLLLRVDLLTYYCRLSLVLRSSETPLKYHIVGAAMIQEDSYAAPEQPGVPSKSTVRLFLDTDDLICLSILSHREQYNGDGDWVNRCLTTKISRFSGSSYVVFDDGDQGKLRDNHEEH